MREFGDSRIAACENAPQNALENLSANSRRTTLRRWSLFALVLTALAAFSNHSTLPISAQEKGAKDKDTKETEKAKEQEKTAVVLIQVPLPLKGNVDQLVQEQIARGLLRLPKDAKRPTLILEFRPDPESAGEGSDFGRAHSLARFLVGESLATVKTVAYLPHSVKGHAVLPVLACEQIVMSKDADLGAAGIDEKLLDETMRGAHRARYAR
jgi:hypothetical protein